MKKYLILLLPILLTSCHIKVIKDRFFTEKELERFSLKGFPTLTFEGMSLKVYDQGMECYFNGEKEDIYNYVKDINTYFQNSDLTFGGDIPSTMTFNVLGGVDKFDVYPYEDVNFYLTQDFGYTFYYQVGDTNYMVDLVNEENKIGGIKYQYCLHIHKDIIYINSFLNKDDYIFTSLTKEIFDEHGEMDIYYENGSSEGTYLLGVKATLDCMLCNLDLTVHTTYLNEDKDFNLTFDKKKRFENKIYVNSFISVNKAYEEGDLIIKSYDIADDVKILLKNK